MNSDNLIYLIYQQNQGSISPEDAAKLKNWLESDIDNQNIKLDIENYLHSADTYKPSFNIDLDKEYKALRTKMDIPENASKSSSTRRKAIVWILTFLLLGFAVIFYFLNQGNKTPRTVKTLPNQFETIHLPDGSVAYLNKNSSLEFTKAFKGNTRSLKLEGEAFFEVAKNTQKPFIVELPTGQVTVLGTSFNINTNDDDQTQVTVATGLVRLTNKSNKSIDLKPLQQGIINNKTSKLTRKEVNNLNAMSWKSKKLEFKNEPLTEVFKVLEKQFNIVIDCKNQNLKDCPVSMTKRVANLESILASFEKLYQIKVNKTAQGKYIITNGIC